MPGLSERDIPRQLRLELPRLKQEFKHVYAVETEGGIFALRPLTWNEYKLTRDKIQADLLPEVSIVNTALVWPEKIPDDAPAGIIPTLALAVLTISGFDNVEAIEASFIHAEHQINTDPEHYMVMIICKAFPAYKPEELYDLQFLDLIIRFKQAQRMLGLTASPEENPRRERRERAGPPIQEIDESVMKFGVDEEFIPQPVSPVSSRVLDPLRDPNLPSPNFERDNKFFRKNFTNALMETPHPGEV